MKVKDLQKLLAKADPELDVMCYAEDGVELPEGHHFRLFDVLALNITNGELKRGDDQIASIKFGGGPQSRSYAFLEISADM